MHKSLFLPALLLSLRLIGQEDTQSPPPPPAVEIIEEGNWESEGMIVVEQEAYEKEPELTDGQKTWNYMLVHGEIPTAILLLVGHKDSPFFPSELLKAQHVKGADVWFTPRDSAGTVLLSYRTMRMRFTDGRMSEQTTMIPLNTGLRLVGTPEERRMYFYKEDHVRIIHNWVKLQGEARYNFLVTDPFVNEYLDEDAEVGYPSIIDYRVEGDQITSVSLMCEDFSESMYQFKKLDPFQITGDTAITNLVTVEKKRKEVNVITKFHPNYGYGDGPLESRIFTTELNDTLVTTRYDGSTSWITSKEIKDKNDQLIYRASFDEKGWSARTIYTYDRQGRLLTIKSESKDDTLARLSWNGGESKYGSPCHTEEYTFSYSTSGLLESITYTTCDHTVELEIKYLFGK